MPMLGSPWSGITTKSLSDASPPKQKALKFPYCYRECTVYDINRWSFSKNLKTMVNILAVFEIYTPLNKQNFQLTVFPSTLQKNIYSELLQLFKWNRNKLKTPHPLGNLNPKPRLMTQTLGITQKDPNQVEQNPKTQVEEESWRTTQPNIGNYGRINETRTITTLSSGHFHHCTTTNSYKTRNSRHSSLFFNLIVLLYILQHCCCCCCVHSSASLLWRSWPATRSISRRPVGAMLRPPFTSFVTSLMPGEITNDVYYYWRTEDILSFLFRAMILVRDRGIQNYVNPPHCSA